MDPLWIVNQEIADRKATYDSQISQLSEERDRLRDELRDVRESRSRDLANLVSEHDAELAELYANHKRLTQDMRHDHEAKMEVALNRTLADRLLCESECEDTIQALSAETQSFQLSHKESRSAAKQESDAKLRGLRELVEGKRTRAAELKSEIAALMMKLNNGVHRCSYATPYDKDIKKVDDYVSDLALQVNIRREKLDDQYQRAAEVQQFQLRKLRQEVREARERALERKARTDEISASHAERMRALRCELVKLTKPTPIRVPSRRKLDAATAQVSGLAAQIQAIQVALAERGAVYEKLKARNEALGRDVRRQQFALGVAPVPSRPTQSALEMY
jgi:hypothetical protein